eukprot:341972_1
MTEHKIEQPNTEEPSTQNPENKDIPKEESKQESNDIKSDDYGNYIALNSHYGDKISLTLSNINDNSLLNLKDILSIIENIKDSKVKYLLLVRHGEGHHNIKKNGKKQKHIKDAELTEKGIIEAKALLNRFKLIENKIELLIISPLSRAIQTAQYGIIPLINNNKNINKIVLDNCRERMNTNPCCSRLKLSEIKDKWKEFNFKYEGFKNNDDIEFNKHLKEKEPLPLLWKRAQELLDYIWNRKENVVIYCGHGGMNEAITHIINGTEMLWTNPATIIPVILSKKSNL